MGDPNIINEKKNARFEEFHPELAVLLRVGFSRRTRGGKRTNKV